MRSCLFEMVFEKSQAGLGDLLPIEPSIGRLGHGFAQFLHAGEHLRPLGLSRFGSPEFFYLALGQQLRLRGESEQVVVIYQQLQWAAFREAVVEGVDQVQSSVAGAEIEWLGGFRGWALCLQASGMVARCHT